MKNKYCALLGAGLLALTLTGCFSPVPKTEISGEISGQKFNLSNPKNTIVTNLVVEMQTNGTAKLTIGYLSSANDSNVISAASAGQAEMIRAAGDVFEKGVNAGANLAGKAGAAAIK